MTSPTPVFTPCVQCGGTGTVVTGSRGLRRRCPLCLGMKGTETFSGPQSPTPPNPTPTSIAPPEGHIVTPDGVVRRVLWNTKDLTLGRRSVGVEWPEDVAEYEAKKAAPVTLADGVVVTVGTLPVFAVTADGPCQRHEWEWYKDEWWVCTPLRYGGHHRNPVYKCYSTKETAQAAFIAAGGLQ